MTPERLGETSNNSSVIPFLKWAGGKRWLTALTTGDGALFPKTFGNYLEPFLGGGAVFFHLAPPSAVLSDINRDLIEAYSAIRDSWAAVVRLLSKHQNHHSKAYYYEVRAAIPKSSIARAARFLYLNRTCWNGLYRVNLSGQFNVPIGTKSSVLLDSDNFSEISDRLRRTTLRACDFEETIEDAHPGDLLFIDPPYTVKHNTNGFLKYNENIFSWDDQVRLRDALIRADKKGALFIATNANHESIRKLYGKFRRTILKRSSVLSGLSHGRGSTEELLIRNY